MLMSHVSTLSSGRGCKRAKRKRRKKAARELERGESECSGSIFPTLFWIAVFTIYCLVQQHGLKLKTKSERQFCRQN